jgi:D(-)-tartrate dehydratase
MKIVDIREKTIPIPSGIRNSWVDFSKMTASVIAIVTDVIRDGKPVVGYGFNSIGRYAPTGLLHERFIPRLLEAQPNSLLNVEETNFDPHKIWDILMINEKPGGHGERSVAVGTIDMAIWDTVAKIEERPLYQVLAERYNNGVIDEKVFVYAAGGYYLPGKGLYELQEELKGFLEMGYTVAKIKIGGVSLAEDLKRVEAALKVLPSGQSLAVDANGRFDKETAIQYAKELKPYNLFWYEEAGDPLDFQLQSDLISVYKGSTATGENLFSMQDVRNLIRYGGMRPERDFIQMDCALSYGLVEYMKMLDMLKENGWSSRRCIPHGGHQLSLNIAAGLGLGGNESYPGVFEPFGGFADHYLIEDGYVKLPNTPGIGFELKSNLYKILQPLAD